VVHPVWNRLIPLRFRRLEKGGDQGT
jgi:hypothetical protein